MKNNKYHTVETIKKSDRKIIETNAKCPFTFLAKYNVKRLKCHLCTTGLYDECTNRTLPQMSRRTIITTILNKTRLIVEARKKEIIIQTLPTILSEDIMMQISMISAFAHVVFTELTINDMHNSFFG